MKYITIILLMALTITACDKNDNNSEPVSVKTLQEVQNCHNNSNWDSLTIRMGVLGDWKWEQQRNPWTQVVDTDVHKGTVISFEPNGILIINDGLDEKMGTWKIIASSWCDFQVKVNIINEFFGGCLLLCDDEMVFSSSPVDGLDIWYVKK